MIKFLVVNLWIILGSTLLIPLNSDAQLFTELTRQDTTLVYKLPGYAKDPIRASLRKEVSQKDGIWILTLIDAQKKKIEQISYEDEKLEVRKGVYHLYQNEKLIQKGYFDKGYKHGEWTIFFESGKPELICNFRWDKLWGSYKKYNNSGKIIEEGQYRNGQKIGNWHIWLSDGTEQVLDHGNP